jgi:ABC-2 type transport system permease protein
MRTGVAWRVTRQTWTLWTRDRRMRWALAAMLALLLTCVITSLTRQAALAHERAVASAGDERTWLAQDLSHPHDAAHFGRTAFRTFGALAFLDPGVSTRTGIASRLEAHVRQPAHGRAADAGTVLHRFQPVSVATVLQLVLPLFVMLAGFSVFAGEEARAVARLEAAAGVSSIELVAGRAVALLGPGLVTIALAAGAGAIALIRGGSTAADWARLVLFAGAYTGLLVITIGVTLLVSVRARSGRAALVTLLALGMGALWLTPRLAAVTAEHRAPTPTASATQAAITQETRRAPDKTDPASVRLAEALEQLRLQYGVARNEDLPLNLGGLSLEIEEGVTSDAYNRAYASLFGTYARQAALRRWWALMSPMIPVATLSAAASGTDLLSHERFLNDAEAYRYRLVQALNRNSRDFAGTQGSAYVTDLGGIEVEPFSQTPVPFTDHWRRHRWDVALVGLWCLVVWAAVWWTTRRGGVA